MMWEDICLDVCMTGYGLFLKKNFFRSSIFGRGNILRKTGRVVVAPTLALH